MRRRLVWMTALAVVAALAIPHGALADEGPGDDQAGEVEFHGVIEALPDPGPVGDWTVSGRTVHVTDATELEGNQESDCNDDEGDNNDNEGDDQGDDQGEDGDDQGEDQNCDESVTFADGDDVKVEGSAESDGSITATEIEADDEGEDQNGDEGDDDGTVVLKGTAQRIVRTASHVGLWRVSTHPVRVLKSTKIVRNGRTLHRGVHLRVTGRWFAGGTIRATRIAIVR